MSERIKSLDEIKDPEAFLTAYYKAMDDAKETRDENKRLREQADEGGGMEEEVNKWKSRALKAEAKSTLEGQGIKNAERILKYLNLEGVDFDETGNLKGLDDKVNEVKADFPELFDAKKRAGRSSADIHADNPADKKVSGSEAQVARIFNKSA